MVISGCRTHPLVLGFVGACLFVAASARAQTISSASVSGTVRDASDAVIAGADVAIANQQTGRSQSVHSDARGRFLLLYLTAGEYKLTVHLTGFATTSM